MDAATPDARIQERRDGGVPCSALLPGQPLTLSLNDSVAGLRELPDGCVQLVVTSPPYDGLRNYLFANAVVWRDDVTDEEKQSIIAELKAAGVKPRKASRP